MKQDIEEDTVIRKYLMGDLPQEEQLLIEERLFLDSEYFQMRQAIEDDLIDEYLHGELSPNERQRFEKYFLSTPERHEALKIAEALKHYISTNSLLEAPLSTGVIQPSSPPRAGFLAFLRGGHPIWRVPLAASLVLIAISALWLVVRVLRPANRLSPIQAQQPLSKEKEEASTSTPNSQQERNPQSNTGSPPPPDQYAEKREKPGTETGSEPAKTMEGNNQARPPVTSVKRMPAHVYSFILIPGGITRGGGDLAKVALRSDAGSANLQLLLLSGGDFPTYRATLLTDDDKPLREWTGLKSTVGESGKSVSIKVPAKLLRRETYHVKLSGDSSGGDTSVISTYYFQVVK
jgi:hypothetical protein